MAAEELIIYNRLIGAHEAAAGFNEEAAAAARLAGSLELVGRESERTRKRSFLMNQALFTARRMVYGWTLALGAASTALVAMGVQFDSTMEQNRIAMTHFLGSTEAANRELDYMYKLAALTPFEFPQLASATRRFLAFGFSLRDTNRYMKIIGDTAAGLGAGADVIDRLVLVFGQMRASGRVLGNDLLQLEQIGIDVFGAFRRQLGLTQEQVRQLQQGNLFIPANLAIEALMRDMNRQFQGQARAQSKTLMGMLSTLHDFTAQTMGILVQPLVDNLEKNLIPRFTRITQAMSAAGRGGGGTRSIIAALSGEVTPRSGLILRFYDRFIVVLRIFRNVFKATMDGLRDAGKTIGGVAYILGFFLLPIVELLSKHLFLLRIIVYYLALRFIFLRTAQMGAAVAAFIMELATGKLIRAEMFAILWNARYYWTVMMVRLATLRAAIAMFILRVQMFLLAVRLGGLRQALTLVFPRMMRFVSAIWLAVRALWALAAAFFATPVGWIVLALIVLIGTLVILYFKWRWFHNLIISIWSWIKTHWPYLVAALVGPFAVAAVWVIKHWQRVKGWFTGFFGWLKDKAKTIFSPRKWLGKIPGVNLIPGLQTGGTVTNPGWSLVGEHGPELRYMPRGASVVPLQRQTFSLGGGGVRTIRVPVYLDGRVIAEVVAKNINDIEARR